MRKVSDFHASRRPSQRRPPAGVSGRGGATELCMAAESGTAEGVWMFSRSSLDTETSTPLASACGSQTRTCGESLSKSQF